MNTMRAVGGALALGVLTAAAGCSTSATTPPPTAISTAPATTAAVAPDQLALATLNDIVQGDYSAVRTHFDQTMQQKLPVEAIGQGWTAYQQQFGAYQSHGDPQDVMRGDITVVNVPLRMQRQPGQFRLSVHPDGTIAGMFLLKQGVPVS